MLESVFMHRSPTLVRHLRMNQAKSEEEEKGKDRGQKADGKAAKQNKNLSEEISKAYLGTAKVNNAGGGSLNLP